MSLICYLTFIVFILKAIILFLQVLSDCFQNQAALTVSIFSNPYFIHLILSTYLLYGAFQIAVVTHIMDILNFDLLSNANSLMGI